MEQSLALPGSAKDEQEKNRGAKKLHSRKEKQKESKIVEQYNRKSQLYRWHIWHSCYSASVTHKKPQYTCSAWSDRCRHEYGRRIS